ncbi:aspartyl-phosphate phosphatase Spo0E family protein [Paenibacillus sp. R14(2021)]|uniref:aspartyl-phosphate phosphatase Spo0E family protein n=1 Tax=Paenibacillus sp. R14(2021) TaxID=2859228 RepID=UPI001C612AF8|nr:aspartyl-phosphate phosphatase Spo0E family protein [Paenibacillus sp. R14(2021)]
MDKKTEIIVAIVRTRAELLSMVKRHEDLKHEHVIRKSQELDVLLNEYHQLLKASIK